MIKIHFKVTQTDVSVAEIEGKITAGNYKQILCNFDLPSEFDSLVVKASFNGDLVLIENSQCFAPVLNEGHCNLGVYGYSADEDGNLELRISPSPCCLFVYPGSYDKEAAESHQPNVTVLEKLLSDIKTALNGANTATANAQDITDTVTKKLENGEFNGPQGIQGPPGEPGTTDYLELLNKPIIDIDIAGITDFYFREQIPGSAKSPCFYRIVSSDDSIFQIQNVYIDENHKNEPVYEYLTVGDMLFVYDVLDETSDGYQLLSLPFVKSDVQLHFLLLSTIEDEPVQKIYYAPLSTYQQLVQLITNLNDALNDLKTQEKLDIERLQSQTELKLSQKANKEDVPVMPEFITNNILTESEIYGLDETDGVKTKRNINVNDGSITDTVANKYYSSMIPVTRKMQITAFSVTGGKSVTSQNNIAAVVYNKDGVMTSKICGETQNVTSNGKAEQSYEVTKILEPSDDCAYVRLGSTHHYLLHLCQAKIFLNVEEKINAMQEQIDAQAIAVSQEVSE